MDRLWPVAGRTGLAAERPCKDQPESDQAAIERSLQYRLSVDWDSDLLSGLSLAGVIVIDWRTLRLRRRSTEASERSAEASVQAARATEESVVAANRSAEGYGDRRGIVYSSWRAAGVSPTVLAKAGIARTRG